MGNKLQFSFYIIILISILVGCNGNEGQGDITNDEDTSPTFPVEVSEVTYGELTNEVKLSGNVMANDLVPVLPMVTGEVQQVHVKNGDRVERGDILLEFDATDIELNVAQARAGLDAAEANLSAAQTMREQSIKQAELQLEQANELYEMIEKAINEEISLDVEELPEELESVFQRLLENNLPTESDLNQASTAVRQAELALNQAKSTGQIEAAEASVKQGEIAVQMAEQQKKHATIVAPISGEINGLNISAGAMVAPQGPVLQIINMENPIVQVNVNETLLPNIEVGKYAAVLLNSLNKTYEGQISYISLMPGEQSRSYPVHIEISNNSDNSLRIGMLAEVTIKSKGETGEQLIIPVSAVVDENNEKVVYVTTDGESVERRAVTIIGETTSVYAIGSGLNEGEYVVTRGNHQLYDGALINIRNDIDMTFESDVIENGQAPFNIEQAFYVFMERDA
ncbi:efflux RND transporter periplasmic adaptor subunit [Evansella sp. AB-P1]|uniref:efflux RND transporter periplasmic adaptor subunit n=1 Tax=Evansella sp. AB-P1 TaxID=3037653 RepID=UPI00241DB688|nr:efflux RND transporter periplasmic adaptor subunit [Evansella sp. AB-P1]MDG5787924.1 efflux RND transporter periplasmic adaptor subunit [Evansella sp. AB-P1]